MSTIFDVAKAAGVSKSTVSRVLNGESGVKEATREAVEKAIRELKYTPSYLAQGIRTGKTKTMTIAIYSEVIRGNYGIAAALSTILTVITICSIFILFKVTGTREISM